MGKYDFVERERYDHFISTAGETKEKHKCIDCNNYKDGLCYFGNEPVDLRGSENRLKGCWSFERKI